MEFRFFYLCNWWVIRQSEFVFTISWSRIVIGYFVSSSVAPFDCFRFHIALLSLGSQPRQRPQLWWMANNGFPQIMTMIYGHTVSRVRHSFVCRNVEIIVWIIAASSASTSITCKISTQNSTLQPLQRVPMTHRNEIECISFFFNSFILFHIVSPLTLHPWRACCACTTTHHPWRVHRTTFKWNELKTKRLNTLWSDIVADGNWCEWNVFIIINNNHHHHTYGIDIDVVAAVVKILNCLIDVSRLTYISPQPYS